jgi:DNA-binding CsgD family transcriptional regulator
LHTGWKGSQASRSLGGRFSRAASLFGAAAAIRTSSGTPLASVDRVDYDRDVAGLRVALGTEMFTRAWTTGLALAPELSIAAALSSDDTAAERAPALDEPMRLTARESEVARLVAQGLTNRDIAHTLTVSERTVEAHVSNALGKLGFGSRTQLAIWAAGLQR